MHVKKNEQINVGGEIGGNNKILTYNLVGLTVGQD